MVLCLEHESICLGVDKTLTERINRIGKFCRLQHLVGECSKRNVEKVSQAYILEASRLAERLPDALQVVVDCFLEVL